MKNLDLKKKFFKKYFYFYRDFVEILNLNKN